MPGRRWGSRKKMRMIALVLGMTTVIGPLVVASAGHPASNHHTPHPQILITGDSGPTGLILMRDPVTEMPVYRPGSGVSAGNGTAEDPFIIEGWRIDAIEDRYVQDAIQIRRTSAHVVVRDNLLTSPGGSGVSTLLAANVTITSNRISDADTGISLYASHQIEVRSNLVRDAVNAVSVQSSREVEVSNNDLADAREGVRLWDVESILMVNNSVHDAQFGVHAEDAFHSVIRGNRFEAIESAGVEAVEVNDLLIEANEITSGYAALSLTESRDVRVEGNRLNGSSVSIRARWIENLTIHENDISGPELSVELFSVTSPVIRNNTIQATSGIDMFTASMVTVEGNHVLVTRDPFYANRVSGLDVRQNVFTSGYGLDVFWSTNVTMVGNLVTNDAWYGGIDAHEIDGLTIRDNIIKSPNAGLFVTGSTSVSIGENDLGPVDRVGIDLRGAHEANVTHNRVKLQNTTGQGVWVRDSPNVTLISNLVEGECRAAMQLERAHSARTTDNRLQGCAYGLLIENSTGMIHTFDRIHDNQIGVGILGQEDGGGHLIHNSAIVGNGIGAVVLTQHFLDATLNWWGCPGGPDAEGCDDVQGPILFDPWRTEPLDQPST